MHSIQWFLLPCVLFKALVQTSIWVLNIRGWESTGYSPFVSIPQIHSLSPTALACTLGGWPLQPSSHGSAHGCRVLSTLWLENTIKWTGVGSLQRKLAGLRCEYPRSWTNKNQSFPSPVEMALGEKFALISLCCGRNVCDSYPINRNL